MSDTPGSSQRRPERRRTLRHWGRAGALVIRDSDRMRLGIEADLRDVAPAGIGLTMDEPLEINEHVKIQLTNEIQKIAREVRGLVRYVTEQDDGGFRIGIELLTRLTPLDVLLLRMGIRDDAGDREELWM